MQDNHDSSARNENEVTADAVTGAVKPKQFPLVVFPSDKDFVQDLKEEFGLKSDPEAFRVLLTVAIHHRFAEDGTDRFEAVSKVIEEGRAARKRASKLADLERQIAELKKLAGQ
jgi:uncharacterized protein YcbX